MRSIIVLKTSELLCLCSTVVFVYTTSKCLCILRYHESLMTAMAFEKKEIPEWFFQCRRSTTKWGLAKNPGSRLSQYDCSWQALSYTTTSGAMQNYFLPYCGYVMRKYQWIPPLFIKIIGCKSMGVSCLCSHKQQFTKTKTCKNCLGLVNWYC